MPGAPVVGVQRLLDEPEPEHVAVESDRPVEIGADQRDVVDPADLEPAGLRGRGLRGHEPESRGTGADPEKKKNQTPKPTRASVALTTMTASRVTAP